MATTPFVLDSDVLNAVSAILHKTAQDPLASEYVEMCVEANANATGDIYRILLTRGYDQGQIAAWDDAPLYALDQAIYWVLMRAPAFGSYPDTFPKQFDRRKELAEIPAIMIGGAPVVPSGAQGTGGVSHGRLSTYDRLLRHTRCNW